MNVTFSLNSAAVATTTVKGFRPHWRCEFIHHSDYKSFNLNMFYQVKNWVVASVAVFGVIGNVLSFVILHKEISKNTSIFYLKYLAILDVFCSQIKQGVYAIIGPAYSVNLKAVHPLNFGFHIPIIAPSASDPHLAIFNEIYRYILRLSPTDALQSVALADFVHYFHFMTMVLLTDDTEFGINGLSEFQTIAASNKWRILSAQRVNVPSNVSMLNASVQLQNIKHTGARVVLLHTHADYAVEIMKQANQLGMLDAGWLWIGSAGITITDTFRSNMNQFPELKGFVAIRKNLSLSAQYDEFYSKWLGSDPLVYPGPRDDSVKFSLIYYDAVLAFANAMHNLLEVDNVTVNSALGLDCKQIPASPWLSGEQVYQYLKQVDVEGLVQHISFDDSGGPNRTSFEFVVLQESGWTEFGSWIQDERMVINALDVKTFKNVLIQDIRDHIMNFSDRPLNIVTVHEPPFVIYDDEATMPDGSRCAGLDCFSGLVIELLRKAANDLKFDVNIRLVSQYGVPDIHGQWDGLIKELIDKTADIAVGPITINSERQNVVSFTKPFLDHQMSIAFAKVGSYSPWAFSKPLSIWLWMCIGLTAMFVPVHICLLDKLSPYGHHGSKAQLDKRERRSQLLHKSFMSLSKVQSHRSHVATSYRRVSSVPAEDTDIDMWDLEEWEDEKAAFSVTDGLFWSFGCLLGAGGAPHPSAWCGRIAALTWWLGCMIIVATYTANLAAFLTIKQSTMTVNSIEDLAVQTDISFGVVTNSSAHSLFQHATIDPYQALGESMHLFTSLQEGIEYTIERPGTFALIADSPALDYWKGQRCELTVVGEGFGSAGYGFALQKGSSLMKDLTVKILKYREDGYIDNLFAQWISDSSDCPVVSKQSLLSTAISMESLWGIFWIIYVGFFVGFLILFVEWGLAIYEVIDADNPEAPHTIRDALREQLQILRTDFLHNWFPCTDMHVPDIIPPQISRLFSRRFSRPRSHDSRPTPSRVLNQWSSDKPHRDSLQIPNH
ncbi:glutamate receptor 2-like [Tubulanus polymorphus]|uniref:glutamate receptor 2-like n=1 Tax=Tubulanus polymorphus TaxID=672921 RepID=UPI003DA69AB6